MYKNLIFVLFINHNPIILLFYYHFYRIKFKLLIKHQIYNKVTIWGGENIRNSKILIILVTLLIVLTVISTINATTTENSTTQRSVAHQNKVNDLTPVASTNIKDKRTKNSFKDLNDSIVSTTKEVNLTKDYKFDKNSDYNFSRGIRIDNKNLIINGNYHVIDALNMTRIFNINSSNVTINNLILKIVTYPH